MNKAYLMRHGLTNYKQGIISLEDACDIVDEAKPIIRASTKEIYDMTHSKGLEIKSSPYGRGLATAKEVYAQLEEMGAKPGDIIIDKNLEEFKGESGYKILHALARGGELDLDGNKYFFDIEKSNPRKLSEVQFFRQDQMHDPQYQRTLPADITRRIGDIETCKSTENRLNATLDGLTKDSILVMHEGPTGTYVTALTGNPDTYLDRGKFIKLQKIQNMWTPTYSNGTQTDSYTGKDI